MLFGNYKDIDEFKRLAGYEIDGFWYPRVTKIVEIKAKPALYRFYGNLDNFEAGEKIKQQSAAEGTLLHETVEALMVGKPVEIPQLIAPAVHAFLKFAEERGIQVDKDYVEKRLVNYEERYAGTLDAIGMIDGRVGILDIKTSQAVYRDYALQTSAYFAAMKDRVQGLETRWILRIDQDQVCLKCQSTRRIKGGTEKIRLSRNPKAKTCQHEWGPMEGRVELQEFPYWREDFQAFLGAKKLWEWENDYWLKKIGYN